MKSKYKSGKSVGKNQTVPINVDDPRLAWNKIGQTKARQGSEIDIIGLDGKSLVSGGTTSSGGNATDQNNTNPNVTIPPIDNKPPISYPGGSGPVIIVPTDPTNVTATWGNYVSGTFTAGAGDDLKIDFTFDPSLAVNTTMSSYVIKLTSSGIERTSQQFDINKASTSQSVVITKAINTQMFNIFTPTFTSVCVQIRDPLANKSQTICAATVPGYILNLNAPTISVASANNGYVVTVTNPSEMAKGAFDAIDIWEIESTASTAPTITYGADGVTPSNYSRVYFSKINPATITSINLLKRWVVARFSSGGGIFTAFSTAYAATPVSPVSVDLTPPTEVTAVTASWSGDNIVINYTLPSTDPGVRFLASLTSPNSLIGSFYFYPDGTASLTQTTTITKNDLFNQFGNHYSSYSGIFKSIDAADNRSAGVSFNTNTRANPLLTVTPTFSAVAISNGYTISYVLPEAATYAEVYQKYTSWSGFTNSTVLDTFSGTRSALGTSGTNTVTITGVVDNNGIAKAPLTGYSISGTGVPPNTFISAVTGTGPYTLTLSKYDASHAVVASNFTTNALGLYSSQALVYAGVGPATLSSTIYEPTYIIIKFYDDFDNQSLISAEQAVTPINPSVVDNTVPAAPTLNSSSNTSSTATFNIVTTDVTAKGYKLRYKKNSDTLYTTVDVSPLTAFASGTSTTPYTLGNLVPSTLYDISAAGYNQYNGVGSYSTNLAVTTSTPTVSLPTSLVTTNTSYGIRTSWSAASNTPTTIARYKVELYNSSNTKLLTDYTTSLVYDFVGLTAGTAYYVKVYAEDIYGLLSAAVTSTPNITVVSISTDGTAPSTSPTPTVNSLYGALEIKWTGITNKDAVTYEVHVSTATGFTPSAGTKAMETSGTLAVIRTLPGTSTALTYGTTYYVKLIAKDADGSAAAGTQASASPSQVGGSDVGTGAITNTQIAANTITSGQIAANTITAGQIAADTITATEIAANAITASEIATSALTTKTFQVGSLTTYPMYMDGAGTYTATYSGGGLVNRIYAGTGTWSNKNTPFYIDTAGYFSLKDSLTFLPGATGIAGTLTVNGVINASSGNFAGAMTVNNGTMKIGTDAGGTGLHGIYIGAGNYWYSSGNLSVGNALTWNGTVLNVNGSINTNALSVTGATLIGGSGYLVAATSYSITNVVGNGTTITYTATNSLSAGQTITVVGINPSTYNLTNATVATASGTQFTVTNAATGTYVSGGTVMVTGGTTNAARIQLASTALTAYDANGNATTQIVSNAANGANTFITTRAKIADWTITDSKIESTLVSGITKYTGLSASNTSYSFWAGATTAGNTDNTAPFSVTPLGAVKASNIQISGGTLDVGAASPNGFHVTSAGVLTATGATISGTLTATSGDFTGNVKLGTSGSLYSGTMSGNALSGLGFIINTTGLLFQNAGGSAITQITSSDGKLITTSANIGGWAVDSTKIAKTSLTGGGNISLDSSAGNISVSNTNVASYTAGINATTTAATSNAFWAGSGGATSTSNGFRVTLGGILYATGAEITGKISSTTAGGTSVMSLDAANDWISLTQTAKTAYILQRNDNLYITAPSATAPWTGGTGVIASSGPVSGSYFAAGSSFKDPWGNAASGIGMYTGAWDYFSTGASDPFVTITKNNSGSGRGIQLSAAPELGMLIEKGGATGDSFTVPTMLIYTAKNATAPYSPSTTYGAYAKFTANNINFSINTNTYIDLAGSISGGTSGRITLSASNGVVVGYGVGQGGAFPAGGASAYAGASKIVLDPTYGVVITGVMVQRDLDMTDAGVGGSYRNTPPLGRYPRSRMLIEDPVTGEVMLGMAVYYRTGITTTPTTDTGYAGDLLVQY